MANLKEGPMSGFRDFLPETAMARRAVIDQIENVYRSYGFVPLETPVLERRETLLGKYGEEANRMMYWFQGPDRTLVAMRYDLTVPLARVIAQHQDKISFPFKRYQIGNVWRGERPQAGRYREFMQFDADTVGAQGAIADAEIVLMMADTMKALGVSATIRVNNRLLLDALAEECNIHDSNEKATLIRTIDKRDKIGADAVASEISHQFGTSTAEFAARFIGVSGDNGTRLKEVRSLFRKQSAYLGEGMDNLLSVFAIVDGVADDSHHVIFDPSIARGLDYYTGVIFETTVDDKPGMGSVFSGGRYDELIAVLGGPDLPAVGASVGVDRLIAVMQALEMLPKGRTRTEVMLVNFGEKYGPAYMKIARTLREAGVITEIYLDASRRVPRQLDFANRLGIPYAIIPGPEEMERGTVGVKNMHDGHQDEVPIDNIVDYLKSQLLDDREIQS